MTFRWYLAFVDECCAGPRFVKYPWFSAVEPNESIWALPHYQSKCQQQTTCAAPLRYLLEERILASHMPQAMAW